MRIDISYNYILYSDLKLVMDALAFFRYFDLKKKIYFNSDYKRIE